MVFKNFRDRWVGATESNLEKIFSILHALGQVEKYPKTGNDARKRAWVQKYGQTVKAAKSMIGRLNEKYPDAKAVKQAEGLLDERWPTK